MEKFKKIIINARERVDLDVDEHDLEEAMNSIDSAIKIMSKYSPNDLRVIFDDDMNGIRLDDLEGDTIEEAIFRVLDNYLSVEDRQIQFVFITKDGAKEIAELYFDEN